MNSSFRFNQRNSSLYNKYPLLGFVLLIIIACDTTLFTTQSTQTPVIITATIPTSAKTAIPSATAIPTKITSTLSPSCTVLEQLNLRSGPGTAYVPPIDFLKTGTKFVPIGYNPHGIPGGSWVQARLEGSNQVGWVSAGEQFVSCNIDPATLPEVTVALPPKAAPPTLGTGAVDGDNISAFRFALDYNPDYMVRMYVFRSDDPTEDFTPGKDGQGISAVEFQITSPNGDSIFYDSTESNAGFCIFGGGEPNCNPWTYENGQYKWGPNGNPVEKGNYKLTITVKAEDGQTGVWFMDVNLKLQ